MKVDTSCLGPVQVEVAKVRFNKIDQLGIEFSNEIDAWAQMEFKFRQQIQKMQRENGKTTVADPQRSDSRPLRYAFREALLLD